MSKDATTFAPGSRVLIRDEEWLVKRSLPTSTGTTAVNVIGLSELVRNHDALFLAELENITELKPEDTKLVQDDSPQYRRSRLYIESLLRRTPPTDEKIYLGQHGALDPAPYQLTPAHQALKELRPRILIADGVGLGKTVEVGILMSELIKRGRGERILVVAIKSMLAQFQEEIWARFSIPLVRLDSVGLQRVRAKIPSNKNPFYYYNRAIISVDTLKNDAQYRHYLEQCHWDIIVIDECHNVANTGSMRNRLAGLLARTCDSLILTSATPHNGRSESFANLMNMLEPTAIADRENYKAEEIEGMFVRRFKKDIEDQVADAFSERETKLVATDATAAEEAFFDRLSTAKFRTLRRGRSDALYRIGLLKGFLSSPDACLQTINGRSRLLQRRLAKLRGEEIEVDEEDALAEALVQAELWGETEEEIDTAEQELLEDLALLTELRELAEAITPTAFSKYQRLLALLKELGVTGKKNAPRLIIFSERLLTLKFLQVQLMAELGVGEEVIIQFHAGLPDVKQQEIVESFGKEDSPIRIMLASNVASEGVNLHYYCHLMVHFDIPWSLITLEQRNGRIDRYGQHTPPIIHYLLTRSQNEELRGDLRVLDKLIEKEQEAHKNIGDAAIILQLYEAEKEEQHITQALADGKSVEEIIPDVIEEDWLSLLMAGAETSTATEDVDALGTVPSLFTDDLAFIRAAFEELAQADGQSGPESLTIPEFHPDRQEFTFIPPEDLRRRLEFIPEEAWPQNGAFHMTTNRKTVMKAMADARKREKEWPQTQLMWELHPVMEWLTDKLLVRFGRHEAPLIIAPKLGLDSVLLLFQGIISNERSQPLITDWYGLLLRKGGGAGQHLSLAEALTLTQFDKGLANSLQKTVISDTVLHELVGYGVKQMQQHMAHKREERGQELGTKLRTDLRALMKWHDAAIANVDARQLNAQGAQYARLAREKDEIKGLFKQRQTWLNETLKSVNEPYLRLALVFTGN